mgnify:CR=1 FL=1
MAVKFYVCPICGNIVGLINGDMKHMTCCGKQMEELKANSVDASIENNYPNKDYHKVYLS